MSGTAGSRRIWWYPTRPDCSPGYRDGVAGGPAAGGGRWVEVDPPRLSRWLAGFAQRHGRYDVAGMTGGIRLRAAGGSAPEGRPPPGAAGCLAPPRAPRATDGGGVVPS